VPRGGTSVRWDDSLAIGVEEIDTQHRQLYAQVAALQEAVRYGEFARAMVTLDFLERYVSEHFAAEERWMAATRYPGRPTHVRLHRAFVAEFLQRKEQLLTLGPGGALAAGLAGWLAGWIEDHVEKADLDLSRYANERD
jgi:hemerythrin-like metal-binding protein